MKKILIICDFFSPSTAMGAVRPSKMAKYLTNYGYEVDVFTRNPTDEKNRNVCRKLYFFEETDKNILSEQKSMSENKKKKNHGKIYKFIYSIAYATKDILNSFKMLKEFKKFVFKNSEEYDVVFSTFGPIDSLLCGIYYKKKFPGVNWICDFRDPAVVDFIPFFKKIYLRYIEQKACRLANSIVAVSNGYLERICRGKFSEKSYMIPNGYDIEDKKDIVCEKNSDTLELICVGNFYGGLRDVSPLFRVIKELLDEEKIKEDNIKFNYAGSDYTTIFNQANQYGVANILVNHGLLSREDCLKLQFKSDLLVLANWNTRKEYGVFPGKLLEYMLIGKPVIALTKGDISHSEMTQVIKEGNLGVSWEETNEKNDNKMLKDYIKEQYDRVTNGDMIEFCPVDSVIERYDYKNIVKKIEALIDE